MYKMELYLIKTQKKKAGFLYFLLIQESFLKKPYLCMSKGHHTFIFFQFSMGNNNNCSKPVYKNNFATSKTILTLLVTFSIIHSIESLSLRNEMVKSFLIKTVNLRGEDKNSCVGY